MESHINFTVVSIIFALVFTATTASRARTAQEVEAAYALLIPPAGCVESAEEPNAECNPDILVRAVVANPEGFDEGGLCRDLATYADGSDLEMRRRYNPRKDTFPVVVCEGLADQALGGAVVGGREVRWDAFKTNAKPAVERTVFIGDTGCRDQRPHSQTCEDQPPSVEKDWFFPEVAAAAANERPNLVIHVGDYRYRNQDWQDEWEYWKKDFFQPASELLAVAPWIAARGNHDVCSNHKIEPKDGWKGDGWLLFFGTHGVAHDDDEEPGEWPSCAAIEPPAKFLPPQAFDVANNLRVVVLDTGGLAYSCDDWQKQWDNTDKPFFEKLLHDGEHDEQERQNWLISHLPIWNLEEQREKKCIDYLRKTVGELLLDGTVSVDAVVAGDIHQFEFLKPVRESGGAAHLTQYVAGHGGAWLGKVPTSPAIDCANEGNGMVHALSGQPVPVDGEKSLTVTGRVGCAYVSREEPLLLSARHLQLEPGRLGHRTPWGEPHPGEIPMISLATTSVAPKALTSIFIWIPDRPWSVSFIWPGLHDHSAEQLASKAGSDSRSRLASAADRAHTLQLSKVFGTSRNRHWIWRSSRS